MNENNLVFFFVFVCVFFFTRDPLAIEQLTTFEKTKKQVISQRIVLQIECELVRLFLISSYLV